MSIGRDGVQESAGPMAAPGAAPDFRLSREEQAGLARDGYVLRHGVFTPAECAEIAAACEDLVARLSALKSRQGKLAFGSYMFETHEEIDATVKWEPDAPHLVQGLEPFAHLSPALEAWGLDPRLTQPCQAICGTDDVILFTEKLNVKRARHGGPIVLHQDYPYWESFAKSAAQVATAMIFLDDANTENGTLEVAPGTHTVGKWKQRVAPDGFGALEMDEAAFDMNRLVPLEVKAGAVAFFGAFLVHRSLPNRSEKDRRALLYSYQPPGHPHARTFWKKS